MATHLTPVFDIGGVFIDWDRMNLFRKLFDTEEEAQWFADNVCTPGWNLELDRGKRYEVSMLELTARFPKYWREIEAYDLRWEEMVAQIYTDSVAVHEELIEQGYKTYSITNFSDKKWREMLPKWSFFQKFDGTIVSGLEELIKPDRAIFDLFLDRYELRAEDCVFIDDSRPNIVAAEEMGFKVVHLTDPSTLRADLIAHGYDLTPPKA